MDDFALILVTLLSTEVLGNTSICSNRYLLQLQRMGLGNCRLMNGGKAAGEQSPPPPWPHLPQCLPCTCRGTTWLRCRHRTWGASHTSHTPRVLCPGGSWLVVVSIPGTKAIQGSFSPAETLPSQNPLLVKAPVELGGSVGGAAGLPAASADASARSTFLSTQGTCTGTCLSSGPAVGTLGK